jgi:small subunit ribosomal protein S20
MPITKGAIKANRASLKKRVFNVRRKDTMNDVVKNMRKLIVAGSTDEAEKMLPLAHKAIDKAAKRGIIKENTAARKKSRLSAAIVKIKGKK